MVFAPEVEAYRSVLSNMLFHLNLSTYLNIVKSEPQARPAVHRNSNASVDMRTTSK